MKREIGSRTAETRKILADLSELSAVEAPPSLVPAVLARVGLADAYGRLDSPLGAVYVAYNDQGVSALMLADDPAEFAGAFQKRFGRQARFSERLPPGLAAAVAEKLAGTRPVNLGFDLRGLTDFERAVLTKAVEIPRGEVRPYAWIAAEIGHPQAVRAVGSALGHNPVPLLIPCHRVVRSDGRIGNYIFGSDAKRKILEAEGVEPARLEQLANAGVRYLGSDTTHIFCYPTCRHARRISEQHRVAFNSGPVALAAGYRACKVCRPV